MGSSLSAPGLDPVYTGHADRMEDSEIDLSITTVAHRVIDDEIFFMCWKPRRCFFEVQPF